MKPIAVRVGLILVLVTVAAKCDPILVEESTARVEEISGDTILQQEEPLLNIQPNSEEVKVNEQVVKGQQLTTQSEDAEKLPSVNENPLGNGSEVGRTSKRAQRMYTETYTYLTAEDIGNLLRRKVHLPSHIKQMQSRSAIDLANNDDGDKSPKDKVYILAMVEKKNAPLAGRLGLVEQMLSIDNADNESEARYTKKALNKYLRKMYRKLRRSVKKYKRKASFRSNDNDDNDNPMTVEKAIRKKRNKKKEDQDIYKLLLG